jgi:hypothetical protein
MIFVTETWKEDQVFREGDPVGAAVQDEGVLTFVEYKEEGHKKGGVCTLKTNLNAHGTSMRAVSPSTTLSVQ